MFVVLKKTHTKKQKEINVLIPKI